MRTGSESNELHHEPPQKGSWILECEKWLCNAARAEAFMVWARLDFEAKRE